MTNLIGVSMPGAHGRRAVLPLLLGLLALLAFASPAPAQQQEWTKIDCASADAHLTPPQGVHADCFQGPLKQSMGQVYACKLLNYSFGVPAEGTEPRFFARATFPRGEGKGCSVIVEALDTLEHVHKFVEAEATNWSAIQTVGSDIQLMFFDAKNQKREGKCASFIKLGPVAGKAGKGHLFKILGFLCKAPGQPLDAAAAAALVNGIRINVQE